MDHVAAAYISSGGGGEPGKLGRKKPDFSGERCGHRTPLTSSIGAKQFAALKSASCLDPSGEAQRTGD